MRMTCCTEKVMTTIRSFYLVDIEVVYTELYVNMGHLGADRTLQLIREGFYWSRMKSPINNNVTPLEVVGGDFPHLKKSSGGFEYVSLLTDNFTSCTQVHPVINKTANGSLLNVLCMFNLNPVSTGKTAANHSYNDFILRFGILSKILHDQGT